MMETHLIHNDELRVRLQIIGIVFGLLILLVGIYSIIIRVVS